MRKQNLEVVAKKNAAKSRKVVILWHFYFSVSKENLFPHISIKITGYYIKVNCGFRLMGNRNDLQSIEACLKYRKPFSNTF